LVTHGVLENIIQITGVFKMNKDGLGWRSAAGGQSVTVVGSELTKSKWIRIGLVFQLRLETKTGTTYKFDGFAEKVRRVSHLEGLKANTYGYV
jgi:hypothetical protein